MISNNSDSTATLVIPCLNEGKTIGSLLEECRRVFLKDANHTWDILVVDNGSTDQTVREAEQAGVTLIQCPKKGYGAAVRFGLERAQTPWILFMDGDGTYDPADAVRLLEYAEQESADMVTGSRLAGTIEPGAMPFLNRTIGTPILSWFLNQFHGTKTSDCNSGIRCLRREAYQGWVVAAEGMEFASELFIEAVRHRSKILELPVRYRANHFKRVPHLRPFPDGWRHLSLIFRSFSTRRHQRAANPTEDDSR